MGVFGPKRGKRIGSKIGLKLKITDLDSYKKSKGLIDIDDPYMGAPLTVYEHTLPHNPSNERKLLFKYSDQIRGKQWDVNDIVQKQLGFNKWMEPLGISAFATALATSTSVPPLVLPVAAIGAVAASGHSNKLKPISDGVKEIWEKIIRSNFQLQHLFISHCGFFCIAFIICVENMIQKKFFKDIS